MTSRSIYLLDALSLQELSLYETNLDPSLTLLCPANFCLPDLPVLFIQRGDQLMAEDVMFTGLKESLVHPSFRMIGLV